MPSVSDPNLLVGPDTLDDAAVFRISDEIALVQTVDFFPPLVDDPYTFGLIAAANALSDVYAMGGTPLMALNIVGFPENLDRSILNDILRGGSDKASEANVLIVGGHTVNDDEPKYGMSVTGIVKPGLQVSNSGASTGDALVLTKPIGSGIITTAGKQNKAPTEVMESAIQQMVMLNHAASDAMLDVGVNACTDVTGYGLLGHLRSQLMASGMSAHIDTPSVPLMTGALELAEQDIAPDGTRRNLSSLDPVVAWGRNIAKYSKILLCDAQTSGGLLISVRQANLNTLLTSLRQAGVETTAVIGEVKPRGSGDTKLITVS